MTLDQQRRGATGRQATQRRAFRGHRSLWAGLAAALYAIAIVALPGLHLWSHAEDHDHFAGGIHYWPKRSPAPHFDYHAEDHHHEADAPRDESFAEDTVRQLAVPQLRPVDTRPALASWPGHAAGSGAHFAVSYVALAQWLAAPLSRPDCTPAIRTAYQTSLAQKSFSGPLGARAPPSALSS